MAAAQRMDMTVIARLAGWPLGRVLLHLIAVMGDRAVRFHFEGIVREVPRITDALRLLTRVRTRLVGALTRYLAQPLKQRGTAVIADAHAGSTTLRQGDVLLTDGNTRMATLVRLFTKSPWSHVSIYVGPLEDGPDPRCIVEATVAIGVRAIPLSEFEGQRLRILRPTGLRDSDRRRVVEWVVDRIGDDYDLVAHAWALAKRLLRLPWAASGQSAPTAIGSGRARFICSNLLANAFVLVGYPIAPALISVRDAQAADHRYVTPKDFDNAPGFEVVGGVPGAGASIRTHSSCACRSTSRSGIPGKPHGARGFPRRPSPQLDFD